MNTTQTAVKRRPEQLLEDSIDQQRLAVLTQECEKGWRTFKSRFVSGSSAEHSVMIEAPDCDGDGRTLHLKPGTDLGVTFRVGHRKCMFGTMLQAVRQVGDRRVFVLRWPERIHQFRRRAFERARVPKDTVVAVRFWQEDAAAGGGVDARHLRHGQLQDISAGGMRVRVAGADDIEVGAVYRCAFTPKPGKPSILLDARVRHREAVDHGRASIGFQYIGLEITAEGRRTLERLARTVSQFQRGHATGRSRRKRRDDSAA